MAHAEGVVYILEEFYLRPLTSSHRTLFWFRESDEVKEQLWDCLRSKAGRFLAPDLHLQTWSGKDLSSHSPLGTLVLIHRGHSSTKVHTLSSHKTTTMPSEIKGPPASTYQPKCARLGISSSSLIEMITQASIYRFPWQVSWRPRSIFCLQALQLYVLTHMLACKSHVKVCIDSMDDHSLLSLHCFPLKTREKGTHLHVELSSSHHSK